MRGEAFFTVAKDPARPFIVNAAGVTLFVEVSRLVVQREQAAIAEVDHHCEVQYGKRFAHLPASTQDGVLRGLDEGSVALSSVSGSFFSLSILTTCW